MTDAPIRHFPSLAEIDAWISEHITHDDDPDVAAADQRQAAAADNIRDARRAAQLDVAAGRLSSAIIATGQGSALDYIRRDAVATLLAADSAGVTELCAHTTQAKPLVLCADPPILVCRECLPAALPQLSPGDIRWEDTCDRCGAHAAVRYGSTLALGHITILSQVCPACHDADEAAQAAALDGPHRVTLVGRNRPCPCGSGKKTKRCCGRTR